jgi:hypothetical protein
MDNDTIALMKLKEGMRLRQQRHAVGPHPANESMTPQIKMIVSNWYTDELGNQARYIKAHDSWRKETALHFQVVGADLIVLRRKRTTTSTRAIS